MHFAQHSPVFALCLFVEHINANNVKKCRELLSIYLHAHTLSSTLLIHKTGGGGGGVMALKSIP